MNLKSLLPLIDESPAANALLAGLERGGCERTVALDAAAPALVAHLSRRTGRPTLVVTARDQEARYLQEQLLAWGVEALPFPQPDALPYEPLAPDATTAQGRVRALHTLRGGRQGETAPLVVASAYALAQLTLSPGEFDAMTHTIATGQRVDVDGLLARWQDMGYRPEGTVEVPGTFSHHGGIIEVYPPASELPARIELAGDEVASIRLFSAATQRSQQLAHEVAIVPAHEGHRATATLLDYLDGEALVVLLYPQEIEQAAQELDAQAQEIRGEQTARGHLPPDLPPPYLPWPELARRIEGTARRLLLERWRGGDDYTPPIFSPVPQFGGRLAAFLHDIHTMRAGNKRIVIVSHQARRLSELLADEALIAPVLSHLAGPPPPGALALVQGSLAQGWALDTLALLTDRELFGVAKRRRQVRRHPVRHAAFLSEMAVGDYVVHVEHGIARFIGTTTLRYGDNEREYLVLEYAAQDRLYCPTDQMDRIARYIGPSSTAPALSRLGTQEWARTRQRVKEAAQRLALELIALYAAREVAPGHAFSRDTIWQEEMEASFPYIETPDQALAVADVKADMERPHPMDRLVCGDVGYGKTEVAVRAAFKAVMDGLQVAVLVPTTVLAQQHLATFGERLAAFPARVEVLSRFRSEREQQEVIADLKQGAVDIVIGTHRLLQRDVQFRDLGLVIIDEEQRFGVAHKEHLKQLRQEVDVLTLSATPIPRTLYMSLSGVRDMSTMETPPEERLPIKTYVSEFDERLVRDAILRELDRGGQVFFVHNRVASIGRMARRLAELVPEAQVAIGHGQMAEAELERVMTAFAEGTIDCLVSTTIIESGLDMPNVNTIIVNDADRLGLSQLYQLRGRVGRSSVRAYAYFLYPRGKRLTPQAQRRLETIFEASELGAGFHIAMRDLEIRGAGNLLGPEQSGHIGAVGFDLYCRLLAEAVAELKEGAPRAKGGALASAPTIDLPLAAYLPSEYVADPDARLAIYQRLARVSTAAQAADIEAELGDRFGPLPPPAENLLYAVRVKVLAQEAGCQSITTEADSIVVRVAEGKRMPRGVTRGEGIRIGASQVRLDTKRLGRPWQGALLGVLGQMAGQS